MVRHRPLSWKLSIAIVSLLAAVAVYCFARIYPPEILVPFQSTNNNLASHIEIFENTPSFFYTLALGLFIGVCASTLNTAKVHCLAWIGLAILLEFSQHSIIAEPLITWLTAILSISVWELIGPYWTHGTFDPLDLLATAMGGTVALLLATYLPRRESDAISS